MEEAERIAKREHGSIKLAVISGKRYGATVAYVWHDSDAWTGVGTRDYYRRLGYELDGPYMSKSLVGSHDEDDDY